MRDYILEKHPDKVEIFDTCVSLGELETEHYWCYFENGKVAEDLFAEEDSPFVGVFTIKQNGYRLSDKQVPYPTDDELIALVTSIAVTGDDLKKTKWQLLAEAYANAKN